MRISEIIGLIGLGMIIISFILVILNRIKYNSMAFNLLNLFGSMMLLIYALKIDSIIFAVLEGFWAIISLVFVLSTVLKNKN